jgi:hypothetical protein
MRSFASYLFRISCCAALVAGLTISAAAASLTGTVTYKAQGTTKSDALPSVLVSVYNPATHRKTVTRTNNLGVYLFNDLPSGLYVLLVEKDGKRIYQGKIEVRDPATRFDIRL